MKKRAAVFFLALFNFLSAFSLAAQNTDSQATETKGGPDFLLIPILETVFSGELRWSPGWPQDIPVDAFSLSKGYTSIELSNDDNQFIVKRDNRGRLVEFPYFTAVGYPEVKVVYSETGALKTMTFSTVNYPPNFKTDAQSDTKNDNSKGEEKTVNIEFPQNFLPFSDLSPGGSFPPLIVTSDEEVYYLFIFETPSFLTETWYDGEGNMLLFCKALVNHNFDNVYDSGWRISSLQIYEKEDISFVDYYYEAGGNISELSFITTTENGAEEKTFSALYRDKKPVFWKTDDFQYEMQLDQNGLLTIVKEAGENSETGAEYRYDYETDSFGNWTKRQETALSGTNLLVPQPSLSRGVWSRRLVYGEASGR